MARSAAFRLIAVLLCIAFVGVVVAIAEECTVVSYEKGKLTVKDKDNKNKDVTFGKDSKNKLVDKDGGEVKGKKAAELLKAGAKVDVTTAGDVTTVKIK